MNIIGLVLLIFISIFCGVVIHQLLNGLSKELDFTHMIMRIIRKLFKTKY